MKWFLLPLAFLALASCAWEGGGRVVGSHLYPAHDEDVPYCVYSGKYGCQVWATRTDHHPESYDILVKDGKGDVHTVDVDIVGYDDCRKADTLTVKDDVITCTRGNL